MSLRPKDYESAKASFRPLKSKGFIRRAPEGANSRITASPARRKSQTGNEADRAFPARQGLTGRKRHRLKSTTSPELLAWGRQVIARDGCCQWPSCGFCHNHAEGVKLAPHHKALRSARPDLRLVLDNGTAVCWTRHSWIHSGDGRDEAIAAGFLNMRTMELARFEGTLGER